MPYYVRQGGRHISGPYDTAAVQEWVKEGRITDDMEVSSDRSTWTRPSEAARVGGAPKRRRKRRR